MYHRSFSKPKFRGFSGQRFYGKRNNSGNRGNYGTAKVHPSKYINKAVVKSETEVQTVSHRFEDFPVDARLKQNIISKGYITPTPIQDRTIPLILQGKDVVGIANTGTGKTAAFLIPIINKILQNRAEKSLIIIPTRELAVQIDEEFRQLSRFMNIYSVLIIGGASSSKQIWDLKRRPNIVIGTPGRLKDMITRRFLDLSQYQTIVLDEVDRMLDIGFVHEIKYMISLLPAIKQSLFFSATLSSEITGIINSFMKTPVTVSVKTHETAENVDQDIIKVNGKEEKILKLSELLKQEEFKKVLIFGRTKWGVERLAVKLQSIGITAASIHGNKSQNQRIRALNQFKQNHLQVLVATDVAARGLDIENVSHVINFDEPATYTDYIHRIGRTGRANKQGKALTFVG
ncbi:MAG: DEAD/DEAH box helicase domain protein [Candidatus Gottesmanbacteria bacterium GW2011_GWC2_39_8]|uniref:DEAD/DEAH box helicase domain protein n=1 Tax=Candidatus Gottesmanbacteria bacterium GW2011_GWC2_39_8 TaxID=1618450 RepID=A0A0G0PUG9_9BACT|nr:MAG: DEAD/DEAH box helicase domain protein [Candidatus Gottesmanbacteria bacterium GW2011_GWC2_39_8]